MSEAQNDNDKFVSAIAIAGASIPIVEGVVALSNGGVIGGIVGLGVSGLVWLMADEMAKKGRGLALPTPSLPKQRAKQPGQPGAFSRMLTGKDDREGSEAAGGPEVPPQFLLDDVLDVIRELNNQGYVYFGDSRNGTIALDLADMYHVLDVSSSGKGKSNRLRLAMMQIGKYCETYYINPLAAPVKAVKDGRQVEVWQPIYDLLEQPPVKEGEDIGDLLATLAAEIKRRNEREESRDFGWKEKPVFVFVDELPEVFARCPDASEYLDQIGRMGRQYCVFTWICSQTAQVRDCGLSTPAQANCKTRIYGGGDETSSKRLMKGKIPANTERTLQTNGAGLTLMLAEGMDASDFTRAPLVTNEGMFEYLELPAFNLAEWYTAPSRSTSKTSGVSTSIAPSNPLKNAASNQTIKSALKRRNEAARSGPEVAEVDEADQEAEEIPQLSDREQQIIDLFVVEGLGMRDIAVKLSGADGGSAYQKASREVTDVIREYLKSMRG